MLRNSSSRALRDYQIKIKQEILINHSFGFKNVLAVMPTGAGKTVVMVDIARDQNEPHILIAHRQELVSQISMALANAGVYHRIIAPQPVIRFIIDRQILKTGSSYYHSGAPVAVAGVDTLIRRTDQLEKFLKQCKGWQTDECFPAGTLVDGRPIETIRIGDLVTAFDEIAGTLTQRKVVRLFKRRVPSHMVSLQTCHGEIRCTLEHPIWTNLGWKTAYELYKLWRAYTRGAQDMFESVSIGSVVTHHVKNKSQICIGSNDQKQSNDSIGSTHQNECDNESSWSSAENARRQRTTTHTGRSMFAGDVNAIWLYRAVSYSNQPTNTTTNDHCHTSSTESSEDKAIPLQSRYGTPHNEDRYRSGWAESQRASENRQAQRYDIEPVRLESLTLLESSDIDGTEDGFVYNIEVDELHTYTANNFIVHNCHHVQANNKWGTAVATMPNAYGIGWTATPLRPNGQSLGRLRGGIFDHMVIGPTPRELIDQGYLCEYIIYGAQSDIDLSNVDVSSSTGDFNSKQLRDATHRSHITGDIVAHYLRLARGKRGVTFAVDVAMAEEHAEAFRAQGVPAAVLHANTHDKDRAKIIDNFERGELLQIVNVDVLGEGFDCPAIEVVSFARPTQSYGLYVQQFGRGLRVLPGKPHGLIIDHVGNVIRHGLPDKGRKWDLDGVEKGARPVDDLPIRTCPECFHVFEGYSRQCPLCDYLPPRQQAIRPEQVEGDLIEYSPELLARLRGEADRIVREQQAVPTHAGPAAVKATQRRQTERRDAQLTLREAMGWYYGIRQQLYGEDDSTIHRRFFLTFGVDAATAQTLAASKAAELTAKIQGKTNDDYSAARKQTDTSGFYL